MKTEALKDSIIEGMQEMKAHDITVMDLSKIQNAFTTFFVICSGNSDTHIESISKSVEDLVYKNLKEGAWHKEGYEDQTWVLMDFVDVVVHIFRKDVRKHYGLEELWADAPTTVLESNL